MDSVVPDTDESANRSAVEAEIARLTGEVRRARLAVGMSTRSGSVAAGVARATMQRLEAGHATHASLAVLAGLGLGTGLRLELTPARTASDGETLRAPALEGNAAWTGGADVMSDAAWLIRLAGREVRHLRKLQRKHAKNLVADGAIGACETLWRWEMGATPQLHHAVAIALCLGARLHWVPISAPWRRRSWELTRRAPGSTVAELAVAARHGRRAAQMTSVRQDWTTPPDLVRTLRAEHGGFALDAAATAQTSVSASYLGPDHRIWARRDAIADNVVDWAGLSVDAPGPVYLNPPFANAPGAGLDDWLARAVATAQRGVTVVAVLPVKTDTVAWRRYVEGQACVRFLPGRLRYGRPGETGVSRPAPFASAVVIWRPSR